uniref:Uncharacterized protein n=1 Tax=Alexandrium andersonii TaxID=327968 RepID=A0A7S2BYZ4_9DINO
MAYQEVVDAEQAYQEMGGGNTAIFVKGAATEVRLGFVRKVYGILATQLALTVAVAAAIQQMPMEWVRANIWLMQVSLAGTIATICALSCCPNVGRKYPMNYVLLFGFTFFEAILVGMISATYTKGLVMVCAGITTAIFLGMTVYAWTSKSDFTGMGPYLVGGLISLFVLGLTLPLLSLMGLPIAATTKLYAAGGVLIFTAYIVYDTQLILGEYKGHAHQFQVDDYVIAALNLYLDVINLFLDLLQLLGDSR